VSVISIFWERPLLPPPLRKLAETEVIESLVQFWRWSAILRHEKR
jgi:hypothetical protein